MPQLIVPEYQLLENDPDAIEKYLRQYKIWFRSFSSPEDASEGSLRQTWAPKITPFTDLYQFDQDEVMTQDPEKPHDWQGFLDLNVYEHLHTEPEARFFLSGRGAYWVNPPYEAPLLCLLCDPGVFVSIPARVKHWFVPEPHAPLRYWRFFRDPTGWLPYFTQSALEQVWRVKEFHYGQDAYAPEMLG